MKKNTLLMLIT